MQKNTSQIMDVIRHRERRFDVDQWTVDGIALWPFLQVRLNFDLCHAHQVHLPRPTLSDHALSVARGAVRFRHASPADMSKNRPCTGRTDVVFLSHKLPFALPSGTWYVLAATVKKLNASIDVDVFSRSLIHQPHRHVRQ